MLATPRRRPSRSVSPSSPLSSYLTPDSSPERRQQRASPSRRGGDDDRDDLPSKIMTAAQYLRIHANATPAKLRAIIKEVIFAHDDVTYLRRLVSDVGGMDYVYRFLWYDGPAPPARPASPAEAGGDEADVTGGRAGGEGGGKGPPPSSSKAKAKAKAKAKDDAPPPSPPFGSGAAAPCGSGRSWIQHCCFHDAHRCLRWIFFEIVRNHLLRRQERVDDSRELRRRRLDEVSSLSASGSSEGRSEGDVGDDGNHNYDEAALGEDGGGWNDEDQKNLVRIIEQLLEYPSSTYCGINYTAVATLRNSYRCLKLLLEYGGLDPSAPINAHGSTAAHLAAWKDHAECLGVLRRGTYARRFGGGESELGGETLPPGAAARDGEGRDGELVSPLSILSTLCTKERTWNADFTRTNALGDTPVHVAAREGSLESMQFFLDLAVERASIDMRGGMKDDRPFAVNFSIRNEEGMDAAAVAAENGHADVIALIWGTIERLVDASIDGPVALDLDFPSPSAKVLWQNPQSYFQPQPEWGSPLTSKSPAQISTPANRRRAKSEPFNIHSSKGTGPAGQPTESPHAHGSDYQQCLPHNFPSLNLRNSSEKHNHEMPIHVAARRGKCAVIEALFKSGNCETTARDSLGQTALHVAALEGHTDACQLFVYLAGEHFEEFDSLDVFGRTPLYIASSLGNTSLVRILFPVSDWRIMCHERRRSPDGPLYIDVARRPPLHAAVANDHVNTVSEMLELGVDVDQTDAGGRTAISAAAKLGYQDMCYLLIMRGANVNKRSTRGGPTPYQKAKKYKHHEVADLLSDFGGR